MLKFLNYTDQGKKEDSVKTGKFEKTFCKDTKSTKQYR